MANARPDNVSRTYASSGSDLMITMSVNTLTRRFEGRLGRLEGERALMTCEKMVPGTIKCPRCKRKIGAQCYNCGNLLRARRYMVSTGRWYSQYSYDFYCPSCGRVCSSLKCSACGASVRARPVYEHWELSEKFVVFFSLALVGLGLGLAIGGVPAGVVGTFIGLLVGAKIADSISKDF